MNRVSTYLARPLARGLIVAFVAAVWLISVAADRVDHREPDEAAWLYSTVYARFFTGSLPEEAWDNPDAVDHPPIAKYLIGLFASLSGPLRSTLEDKDFWHRFDLDMLHRGPFLKELWRRVDPGALKRARIGGAAATAATAGLLTWFGEFLLPGAGVVAGIAFTLHPLIRAYGGAALADPWFLLIALVSLVLAVQLSRALRESSSIRWTLSLAAGLGISLGLLAGTKLTGLALWALPILPILLHLRTGSRNPALVAGLLCWAVALTVFFGLNPALWSDPPWRLLAMLDHRLARVELQQMLFELDAIERLPARIWLGLTDPVGFFGSANPNPFFGGSRVAAMFTVPLFLGLAAVGIKTIWRRRSNALVTLMAGLLLLFIPAITGYYLRWPRYLLPTLPLWLFLSSAGLVHMVGSLRGGDIAWSNLIRKAGLPVFLTAGLLGLGLAAWHPQAIVTTPERDTERIAARTKLERHFGRIHSETIMGRVNSRVEQGRLKEALELARYALQLDPDSEEARAAIKSIKAVLDQQGQEDGSGP
jgi:hypothetical protein